MTGGQLQLEGSIKRLISMFSLGVDERFGKRTFINSSIRCATVRARGRRSITPCPKDSCSHSIVSLKLSHPGHCRILSQNSNIVRIGIEHTSRCSLKGDEMSAKASCGSGLTSSCSMPWRLSPAMPFSEKVIKGTGSLLSDSESIFISEDVSWEDSESEVG